MAALSGPIWQGWPMLRIRAASGGDPVTPEPVDPFPAALLGDAPYAHYAAEDAGATWTARHGLPLVMDRAGDPVLADGWLDCAAGCYTADREAWPADTPFELWALCQPNALIGRQFYNGPQVYSNNPVSFATRLSDAGVFSGNTVRAYAPPAASGPRTYSWARTGPGNMSAVMQVRVANQIIAASTTADRATSAAGDWFVVGGSMSSGGAAVPQGLIVRDVLLTVGWVMSDAQRTALEVYAKSRGAA
ncbi:MAG: hypothetical protein Q4G24_10580 [Paracoccus sp. (in: a-proteobacteria)]|uniref:hypothetical protein n=1 Tax=Paracoccus sp. TaxID=267 RepID=UPI0026DEC3CB|nr:hypothetical protein [Paracoccus sp. (in: a-proteobacteria)]MDO5621903.1 hypothetical protein [Paracoccus sp. (in: a-proteobacteria)]